MSILCWLVVAGTFKVVRKILLSSYMMRMVVSVEVTLAVPQPLRPRIVSVTQMLSWRRWCPWNVRSVERLRAERRKCFRR